MRVRRTTFAVYRLEGDAVIALSALTGQEEPLAEGELETLLGLPDSRWLQAEPTAVIERLAAKGLVAVDEGDAELLRRDEELAGSAWHPLAAAFHFGTKLRGVAMTDPPITDEFVARFGEPPPHFKPRMAGGEPICLVLPDAPADAFTTALARRKTARLLDPSLTLERELFDALTAQVFGVTGTFRQHPAFTALHRTTPQASGLAPLEVYPAILRVAGLEPGLYHYLPERHELELLQPVAVEELETRLRAWAVSQIHVGDAAAVFIVTARFGRFFWKYRRTAKALAVLWMELGHLSQTFYLAAAHLGLGGFFTGAINDWDVEDGLGLDGHVEGALGMLGCGFAAAAPLERELEGSAPFELAFEPYMPQHP